MFTKLSLELVLEFNNAAQPKLVMAIIAHTSIPYSLGFSANESIDLILACHTIHCVVASVPLLVFILHTNINTILSCSDIFSAFTLRHTHNFFSAFTLRHTHD